MSYDVKVAGEKLPSLGYDWQVRAGLAAPIQGWIVPREIAQKIVALYAGREIELLLDTVTVKRVIVLGLTFAQLGPLPAPDLRTLLFTDVRWLWTRGWLVRDVNTRRKGADTHYLGAEVPIDAQTPIFDVQYQPWSLMGSNQPYTYAPFMGSLLEYASRAVPAGMNKIAWQIDPATFIQGNNRVVEEVKLDDMIPQGLARAVAAFPGRSIFPDLDGVVHVSDAAFGAEKALVSGLNPDKPMTNAGHMAWVDMSGSRPSSYGVLFTPEFEVKLWADVNASPSLPTQTQANADDPFLTPVLKIPDKILTVTSTPPGGSTVTRKLAQGSYAPQSDVFKAWGAPSDFGRPIPALTDDIVRKHYLGPWLEINYVMRSVPDPDPIWAARIRETKRSYRVRFQANPVFWDKVLDAIPKRAAVLDQATGTRADSPVFAGFALRPKIRWFAAAVRKLGHNVRGLGSYNGASDDGIAAKDQPLGASSANQSAPCKVHIEDFDQGIFFFEWEVPSDGLYSAIAPSPIEYEPNLDPKSYAGQVALATKWQSQKLVSRFKLATIISCVPAAPNSDKRLFRVDVKLDDAEAYLGNGARPTGKGPVKMLRVGPQLLTPRFAWTDDANTSGKILKAFGCGDNVSANESAIETNLTVDYLRPVNYETEIKPLATAMAAADLATQHDHYEGTLKIPMKIVNPIGSVNMVTYRVTKDESVTILSATGESPAVDVFALLPDTARKTILHQVLDE